MLEGVGLLFWELVTGPAFLNEVTVDRIARQCRALGLVDGGLWDGSLVPRRPFRRLRRHDLDGVVRRDLVTAKGGEGIG